LQQIAQLVPDFAVQAGLGRYFSRLVLYLLNARG
jgi:hypothetical protein